jgi:hypothetical protein
VTRPLYDQHLGTPGEMRLFNFCSSIDEALDCAKKLPYTPVVLSTKRDLPFIEESVSQSAFGEPTRDEQFLEIVPA